MQHIVTSVRFGKVFGFTLRTPQVFEDSLYSVHSLNLIPIWRPLSVSAKVLRSARMDKDKWRLLWLLNSHLVKSSQHPAHWTRWKLRYSLHSNLSVDTPPVTRAKMTNKTATKTNSACNKDSDSCLFTHSELA